MFHTRLIRIVILLLRVLKQLPTRRRGHGRNSMFHEEEDKPTHLVGRRLCSRLHPRSHILPKRHSLSRALRLRTLFIISSRKPPLTRNHGPTSPQNTHPNFRSPCLRSILSSPPSMTRSWFVSRLEPRLWSLNLCWESRADRTMATKRASTFCPTTRYESRPSERKEQSMRLTRSPIQAEQDRLDFQHTMVTLMLDGKLALAPLTQAPGRVLDVATGTGIWALDFGMPPRPIFLFV